MMVRQTDQIHRQQTTGKDGEMGRKKRTEKARDERQWRERRRAEKERKDGVKILKVIYKFKKHNFK